MKILNLDSVIVEDKQVTIDGETYTIPGDLPVETMLQIMENTGKLQENPQNTEVFLQGFDLMIGVFKIKHPDVDIEKIKKSMTMAKYLKLSNYVFGGMEDLGKKPESSEEQQEKQPSQ